MAFLPLGTVGEAHTLHTVDRKDLYFNIVRDFQLQIAQASLQPESAKECNRPKEVANSFGNKTRRG